jgi:cytochrome c peroxidase
LAILGGAHPAAHKWHLIVTHTADDEYVFRVPADRNVELTPPHFQSGSSWGLRQAIAVGDSQLGQKLTDDEVAKITAFLTSLTGISRSLYTRSCHPARQRLGSRYNRHPGSQFKARMGIFLSAPLR